MVELNKKRARYIEISNRYSDLYRYENSREKRIVSSGILNFIWNSWNNFWRDYWLCHVAGGFNLRKVRINGIYPKYSDNQSCHFLLYKIGKRKNHNFGDSINGSYQEATWGDPKVIRNIAFELRNDYPEMDFLLNVLSSYQTQIEHFQKIRNTFIHLNSSNINELRPISSYYNFSNSQKIIDILESRSLENGNRCFEYLNENMTGLLLNI